MKPVIIVLLAVIIITVAVSFWISFRSKNRAEQLAKLLSKGHFEEFDALAAQKEIISSVPPFNLDFMKLNSYLLRNDEKKIRNSFDGFLNVHLTPSQKEEVSVKGFIYFLGKNDVRRTESFLQMMKESTASQTLINTSQMYYDIYCLKKTDYLDRLLEETEKLAENERAENYQLIAMTYRNMGSNKEAEEYEKLAQQASR